MDFVNLVNYKIYMDEKLKNNENLKNFEEDSKEHRLELLEKNNIEQTKQDMWDD